MKQTFFINLLFLVIINFSTAQVKEVDKDSIDSALVTKTYKFAFNTYNACENGNFPILNTEIATERFIKTYNSQKMISYCESIYNAYGKLTKISLSEILNNNSNLILRYKAKYERIERFTEIRVYINKQNRFSGITSKPYWYNEYYEWNENPTFKRVKLDSLEKDDIKRASDFVFSTFNCDKDKFMNLTDEIATKGMILFLTDEELLKNCEQRERELGKLIEFKLSEVLTDEENRILYRYKSKFYKSDKSYEILVTCDLNNRFMGIFRRDWFDEFYELNQEPKTNKEQQ
ncbi:MAG: hypothetical protein R2821_10510 [Flavobacteriaceae bacterium]